MSDVDTQVDDVMVAIREAFDEAVANDSDEDTIKIEMIGAGATFKNVTRLYNEYMVDAGLAVSKEEKESAVQSAVDGYDVADQEGFEGAVNQIVEELDSVNARGAAAMIRSYCRKNDLQVYKKPKGESGSRKDSFTSKFRDWIIENPRASEEDFTVFLEEHGNENQKNNASTQRYFLQILNLTNEIMNKHAA